MALVVLSVPSVIATEPELPLATAPLPQPAPLPTPPGLPEPSYNANALYHAPPVALGDLLLLSLTPGNPIYSPE